MSVRPKLRSVNNFQSKKAFERGDLVWGKVGKYPWWPAIVLNPEDCSKDKTEEKLWLFFFGDYKVAELTNEKIVVFKEHFPKLFSKKNGKKYIHAVEEILKILAQRFQITNLDSESLFKWAVDGFQTEFACCQVTELPEIVLKALKRDTFDDVPTSDCDDDDEIYEGIDKLISDVLSNKKKLEEICISCCKKDAPVVKEHPLFLGGICFVCKKNVDKICKSAHTFTRGRVLVACLICGQGGTLVYCSNSLCLRPFCQLCIECLTPKGSYDQILKDEIWMCYWCKADPRPKCLIRVRRCVRKPQKSAPIPAEKGPINVIAHSNIEMDSFFCTFFKFLFRLHNGRRVKSNLFFAFIAVGEFIEDPVRGHILRYLELLV